MAIARPLGQHWSFGHEVAPTVVAVPVAPSANPVPIFPFALLCIGLALLAIAGTIVLSLIPSFTRVRTLTPSCGSSPFSSTYNINNGLLPIGQLSANNQAALQSAMNIYLKNQAGLSSCSMVVGNGNMNVCPANTRLLQRRKRRRVDSDLIRRVRQTSINCNSQQLTTTSSLNCGCNCLGYCLRQKIAQLESLLLGASIPMTFSDPVSTPVTLTGVNAAASPTTTAAIMTTTTTTAPVTSQVIG